MTLRTRASRLVSRRGVALAGLSMLLLATVGCTEPTATDGLDPDPSNPPPSADLSDTLAISPQYVQALPGQQVVFTAPTATVNGTPVAEGALQEGLAEVTAQVPGARWRSGLNEVGLETTGGGVAQVDRVVFRRPEAGP